jgi:hypothetical protein
MAWTMARSLAAALAVAGLFGTVPLGAATTEYVVVDRNTGLAISGFDPVAYFTDSAALVGRESYEHAHAGVVWRFRNEGNRAAFAADPDIYMPRFGGYDPVAVSRGVGVPGDPRLWLIVGGRLYLFYTEDARRKFGAAVSQMTATSDRTWPAVQLTLSP